MTQPTTPSTPSALSAGVPHVVLDATASLDLELLRAGVRLPWTTLGGQLGQPGFPDVRGADLDEVLVPVPAETAESLRHTATTVILTDRTLLPLARLRLTGVVDGPDDGQSLGATPRAVGRLDDLHDVVEQPTWLTLPGQVVLVQRPPLRGELATWLDGPASRRVHLLVPAGPSPDGIPADVLTRALRDLVRETDARVLTVPVAWRDQASDGALVTALSEALVTVGSPPVEVLWASDARWTLAVARLTAGQPVDDLDDEVVAALVAWRPPPSRRGVVVFFTGLSGSGKSSIADALVAHLERTGERTVTLLDGDVVRHMLSSGLGFDRSGRELNIRRIGYVAAEIAHHHGMAVCAPIAPFAATRQAVREMVEQFGDFVLVHVSTPLDECERRDRKGLYARARAGEIADFTGISSPYESPTDADLTVDTTGQSLEQSLTVVLDDLIRKGYLVS